MFTATFKYDRPFMRRAYLHALWRTDGGYLLAVPVLLLMATLAMRDQGTWWFAGLLVGIISTYLGLLYLGYRRTSRWAVGREIQATLSDMGARFATKSMAFEVPWNALRAVHERADQIELTFRERPRRWILPRNAFSAEAREYLLRKAREADTSQRDGA